MATLTKGKTFANGELVTPQKLHELVDLGTVSGIVNADISVSAAIADTKLAQITTAGKVANSATTATNANTANAIVVRDASGNFSAGTITAALSGNATTATTLQTDRTINGVPFNGSANITVTADPNAHTHTIANVTGLQTALVPAGAVMSFAMSTAPSGWLAANGSAVSRATYAALFASIGTTYGAGDGSTSFNLPDLQGYFIRGTGTNSDGTTSGSFGAKQLDSYKSHNHGGITGTATSGNESQGHTHSGTTGGHSNDHAHYVSGSTGIDYPDHSHTAPPNGSISGAGLAPTALSNSNYGTQLTTSGASVRHAHDFSAWTGGVNANHSHSFTTGDRSANHTHSIPSLSIASDGGVETRPKNIAMLYCIKF